MQLESIAIVSDQFQSGRQRKFAEEMATCKPLTEGRTNGVADSGPSTNGVASKPSQPPPGQSPVVLLIGSTGSGKSTLGNFLLNPKHEHIWDESHQTFPTAKSNMPETELVKVASNDVAKPTLQVIDTPGLNEGDWKDLLHMSDIVKALRGLPYVSACILCVRFNANVIDAQWRATVEYYSKLLPMLFEGNVVIVLTDYQSDERSIRRRKMQGIDVDNVAYNVVEVAKECGNLAYNPQVFHIDSKPMDDLDRPESESDRNAILSYIQTSLNPVRITGLKVAKTEALKRSDRAEMERLDGEIHGYIQSLKQLKEQAEPVVDQIELLVMEMSKFEAENLVPLREEVNLKDTEDLVITKTWQVEDKWKLFQWQLKAFDCHSDWPIADYVQWDNGHLKWKDVHKEEKHVSGKVEGEFMRGLYATLTLKSFTRDKYAERLEKLRTAIAQNENKLERMQSNLAKLQENTQEKVMDDLMKFIKKKREEKACIAREYLTVEEADEKLKEWKDSQAE